MRRHVEVDSTMTDLLPLRQRETQLDGVGVGLLAKHIIQKEASAILRKLTRADVFEKDELRLDEARNENDILAGNGQRCVFMIVCG